MCVRNVQPAPICFERHWRRSFMCMTVAPVNNTLIASDLLSLAGILRPAEVRSEARAAALPRLTTMPLALYRQDATRPLNRLAKSAILGYTQRSLGRLTRRREPSVGPNTGLRAKIFSGGFA